MFWFFAAALAGALWIGLGARCLRGLALAEPRRDVGFVVGFREAAESLAGVALIYFFFGPAVRTALWKNGMDPVYAAIAATFAFQAAISVFLLFFPRRFASGPRFFDGGALRGFLLFLKGAAFSLAVFGLLYAVILSWSTALKLLGHDAPPQDIVGIFTATHTPIFKALLVVSLVFMAPLWEELFFRAGLYGALRARFGFLPAAAASSILFGLIHESMAAFVPISVLGFFFALLYEKYGDIRVSIGAHAAFNLVNVLILVYAPEMSDI